MLACSLAKVRKRVSSSAAVKFKEREDKGAFSELYNHTLYIHTFGLIMCAGYFQ